VALITGGNSGIERAVAVLYAREGEDVAMVYSREARVDTEETRDAVERERRRSLLLPGDVTKSAFCEKAGERTINEFGQLDVLVNNAAFQQHQSSILDVTDEQFEKTFRTNIFGYFYMARATVPRMQPGSAIVNTGSITGLQGSKELLDYAATRASCAGLRVLRLERGLQIHRGRGNDVYRRRDDGGMIIAEKSPPEDFVRFVTS
jgi:NAD(P)-dependent dehydrogenase (short-subunit alcohol dehydrogenase family)